MTYKSLSLDIQDKIAHVQFIRPDQHNTMNTDFWIEFPKVVQETSDKAAARVIVLSSTGKHFCAGMDLSVFTSGMASESAVAPCRKSENLRRSALQLQAVFNLLETARMPVLAAIQGACIGGAVDMISACDSRYCTEDAFFSIEETKLGMTADLGTLQRLPHLIPQGLMRELAYTGRKMYADEAKAVGLINEVYGNHSDLLNGVMDIAGQIAAHSPLAVYGCKEMINYARDHSAADSLNAIAYWQSGMFRPEIDMAEAFKAKMEKRAPVFSELCEVTGPFGPAA